MEGVHWRVLKNAIRVAPRQLDALNSLLYNRIDPKTCAHKNAGRLSQLRKKSYKVSFNRPLQTTTRNHELVFCECVDWASKRRSDQAYCELTMKDRGVYELQN